MGRGKGKVRKLMVTTDHALEDDIDDGNEDQDNMIMKLEEENKGSEDRIASLAAKGKKKRRRSLLPKEEKTTNAVKEESENNAGTRMSTTLDDSVECKGFRHIGSRRKSKPRRAAEAGVNCW